MDWEEKAINFLKSDNRKTIFLVNAKVSLDRIASFFNKSLNSISAPYAVIFWGIEIPRHFTCAGVKIRPSEKYLTKEDHEKIDNYVFGGKTKSWYFYKDVTVYRGIHLGKIFEYDLQKYLTPRIKNLEIIKKAMVAEKAEKIVAIEDSGELAEVAQLYADFINAPILPISLRQKREAFFNLDKFRTALSGFLRDILDRFSYTRLKKSGNDGEFILADTKLYSYFRQEENKLSFMLCPLEAGTVTRFNLLKEKFFYLPLYFRKKRTYSKDWIVYQKRWETLSLDEDFKDIFEYSGISIWEIVNRKIAVFFLEDIPRIISNFNILGEVARMKKIKVAVLRNDVKELERTVILSLRLQKIPSLVIQHGILAESNGHNSLLADKFAAWGKASVEWYGRFGSPLEKFEITGNPRFDKLSNWKPPLSKQLLCKRLNLDANKEIILFATQQINKFSSFWTDDLFWILTDKLLETMQQFPDKQLIIKVDPYEDLVPYKERLFARSYNNAVAVKDIDIYTLIYFSELVMTQDSTVGLEAMLFGKPLVTVNFTKREDRVPYFGKGAALGVYKEADLPSAIEKTLADKETILKLKIGRSAFLEEYAYKIDGKANERILNLLKYYIEN